MRWPWVPRAHHDMLVESREAWMREAAARQERVDMQSHNLAEMRRMYDELFAAYRELRVSGANAPEPEKVIPPPKRPPAIVYRAMRAISPRDDATFAANWRLWEENQDECNNDPEKFAERIKRGRMTPEQPRAD